MNFGGGDEIRFERHGRAGIVTLTRPDALNAVTHAMVMALSKALSYWQHDDDVALVILKAEGRAFSAGVDFLQIHEAVRAVRPPIGFFADEYRLNAQIAHFTKPYISLIDGIVMGGGVGLSFHGSHRVLTEKAQFAMGEVGIGFFPDAGGSFLLSRLKGSYGVYLGLTGARIRAGAALHTGLATHAVRSGDIEQVFAMLVDGAPLHRTLKRFAWRPDSEIDEAEPFAVARLFSSETIGDLVIGLKQAEQTGDSFAARLLQQIARSSPTSVAVAFRQINTGAMLTIDECMRMEFRIVNRLLAGTDFHEGIRATVVETGATPKWRPAALEDVNDADVEAYFMPLPGGDLSL